MQFAGKDNALYALFAQQVYRSGARSVHLRRRVQHQTREKFLHHAHNAEILYEDRIGADLVQIRQKAVQTLRFVFFDDGIDRYVYFFTEFMNSLHRRFELIPCKIGRAQPRVKTFESQINRVGALAYRRVQCFRVSRRSK